MHVIPFWCAFEVAGFVLEQHLYLIHPAYTSVYISLQQLLLWNDCSLCKKYCILFLQQYV